MDGPPPVREAGLSSPDGGDRERVLPAALLAVALAVAGVAVSLSRPVAPPLGDTPTDLDGFAPAVMAAVRRYTNPRYAAALTSLALTVAVPLLLVLTGPGRRVVRWLAGGRRRSPLRAAGVAAAVAGLTSLATLPLDVAIGYVHNGVWGFRTAGALLWARDWVLGNGIGWLLAAAGGAVLVAALARYPRSWHWRLVPVVTVLAAALALLWPLVLAPLFLPTSPLPEGPLRQRLEPVLARAGEGGADLLVGDASLRTTRVNALVTGLGPTRRVILYDNLLSLPPDQVVAVTAHELAHREHADIARGVLLTATGALLTLVPLRWVLRSGVVGDRLGVRGPADPRLVAVAMAVLVLARLVGQPPALLTSRRAEAAADHRALELTGDPTSMIRLVRTFTVRDLSHPRPPGWAVFLWSSHPPVGRRVRAAVEFARRRSLPLPELSRVRTAEEDIRHPRIRGAQAPSEGSPAGGGSRRRAVAGVGPATGTVQRGGAHVGGGW